MNEIKAKHPEDSPSSSYSEQNINGPAEGQGLDLVRKRNDQAVKSTSAQSSYLVSLIKCALL